MRKPNILTILGIIALLYWSFDVINNIFFLKSSAWSLWFSSVGIGLTGIDLITKNAFLLNTLLCALFIGEIFWNIGFFSHLLFKTSVFGLTDYPFEDNYSLKDFLITSYHIFIIPFLFIGIIKQKKFYRSAWIGATFYITILSVLTYFFIGKGESVNCVHTIENCRAFLFFLNHLETPTRMIVAIILATVIIFIPTNYLLMEVMRKFKFSINSQR